MGTRWDDDQVSALAPDAAALPAGRKQASRALWSSHGADLGREVVWGLCQGSGKNPYQTAVDLSGPAFKCSCPSRKIPCKHVLGLLFLWAAGDVPDHQVVGFAEAWMDGRSARAEKASARTAGDGAPTASTVQRAAAREARVEAGLEELDRWLQDQVRSGLAGWETNGRAAARAMAARLVDAQAAPLATIVSELPDVVGRRPDWAGVVLETLGQLHLLIRAHRRLADLDDDLAATVRTRVGYPVASESVLQRPPVRDLWLAVSVRDSTVGRLASRETTLVGVASGQVACILSYAPAGHALDASLTRGTAVDADLHRFPGAAGLRALLGTTHMTFRNTSVQAAEAAEKVRQHGTSLALATESFADAVTADPWTSSRPVVLGPVTPVEHDTRWVLVDTSGDALPLTVQGDEVWRLLAVTGAHPSTVVASLTVEGLEPLSVLVDGRVVQL